MRAAIERALDGWLLVGLVLAASIGQSAWELTHRGGKTDSSRPGLTACVFYEGRDKNGLLPTGTQCNAVNGFCEVTKTMECDAVGPTPYLK